MLLIASDCTCKQWSTISSTPLTDIMVGSSHLDAPPLATAKYMSTRLRNRNDNASSLPLSAANAFSQSHAPKRYVEKVTVRNTASSWQGK